MPDAVVIYTRILSKEEVETVLQGLPSLIGELVGSCILIAEYGCCCNLHNDLLYKPMMVGNAWLDRFLAESVKQRIFVPADSDLSITTPNNGLTILFCHESDIHLSGQDAKLVERATQSDLIRPLLK